MRILRHFLMVSVLVMPIPAFGQEPQATEDYLLSLALRRFQYLGLSDRQVWDALTRYCPGGSSARCRRAPPEELVSEARRRGLIEPVPGAGIAAGTPPLPLPPPATQCFSSPDGVGGFTTDCF